MIKVKKRKILLLPGDGIGPEVIGEVKKIIEPLDSEKINDYLPEVILSIFSENEPSVEILVSHNFPYTDIIRYCNY